MYKSKVNPLLDFNNSQWLISILNSGLRFGFGHSMIVVEGVDNNNLFIGQYDIQDEILDENKINPTGVIVEIRCFEEKTYSRDYASMSSYSYPVTPTQARLMIESIKWDQDRTEQAQNGEIVNGRKVEFIKFQWTGEHHFFGKKSQGINCTQWCLNKLTIAGIAKENNISKPKIASGIFTGEDRVFLDQANQYCRVL